MALLAVSDLTLRRRRTRILNGVNWKVQRGEHWVVLGANGSGKTSLLSALTGYLTPTSGRMVLLGEEFGNSDWRALRLHVGLVSSSIRQLMPDHEPALITVASGRYAIIDFWGTPRREDRIRAQKILKQIECSDLTDRPWIYLSQGERQRVLIGRALMSRPKILILDEPCAGLDPSAREQFLQFLNRLGKQRAGPALILVTHHVEEIMPVFTHALVLRGGKVQIQGARGIALTSASLSKAFNTEAKLHKRQDRYTLTLKAPTRSRRVC